MKTKLYRKTHTQPMAPYIAETGLPFGCSVSQADKDNGSPKCGDMIASNPNDESDTWLVAEKFFNENYERSYGGGMENNPADAMRWLEKLTCGGSEFHDDPENCYNFTRKRLDSNHASLVKQQKRIRELEKIISEKSQDCHE